MICESIDLYAYFQWERGGAKRGLLYSYRHAATLEMAPRLRPAILIFPRSCADLARNAQRSGPIFVFSPIPS